MTPTPHTDQFEEIVKEFKAWMLPSKGLPYHNNSEIADWWLDKLHHIRRETEKGMMEKVRTILERVEIKGRNSYKGDDTKEKGKLLQEMYDSMIKPVLLSHLEGDNRTQ